MSACQPIDGDDGNRQTGCNGVLEKEDTWLVN